MPRLSTWFVRTSLIYLALGVTLGGLLLAEKGIPFYPALWITLPAHMEFMLMGWMVQLAMGMAYWILPRFAKGSPRGNEKLIWVSFYLINIGILVVAVYPWLPFVGLVLIGRLLETAAVVFFAIGSWRRIKPFRVVTASNTDNPDDLTA